MMWPRRKFLATSLMASPLAGFTHSLRAQTTGSGPFKLGIITDEITDDFAQALNFISSYSLHYCELRDLWSKNIMDLDRADLQRAKSLIQQHHLTVSDIGSPIFKYNLPEMPARPETAGEGFHAHYTDKDSGRLLKKSFEIAHFFGTQKVRVFSYWRVSQPEKAWPYVRDRLNMAADLAGRNGILLILENEMDCNVGTGQELGRALKEINSSHLRGNWDPGNAAMLNEIPYPNGYEAVRGWFAHMHIKDVKRLANGKLAWAPVGGGFIDWKGQFEALVRDHYNNTMSLETHYRRPDGNKVESTRESLLGLLKIIHQVS